MWVGVGVPPWPSLAGLDGEWKGGVEGEGRGGRGNDHSGPLPPPSLFCGLGLRGGGGATMARWMQFWGIQPPCQEAQAAPCSCEGRRPMRVCWET